MRQVQVQRALDAFDKPEIHLRQVVVQHQRDDAGLIHLEGQHHQVQHQLHVLGHVLGQRIGRPLHVWFVDGRPPAFETLVLGRPLNPLLDVADRFEILAQLGPVAAVDLRLQVPRLLPHGVENAAVHLPARPVAHQQVERPRRIDLLGRRPRWRRPRDARSVDHRQAIFEAQLIRLNPQRQTRHRRLPANPLRENLVKTRPDAYVRRVQAHLRARKQIGRTAQMRARRNERLMVIEAFDEGVVARVRRHRRQRRADLHLPPFTLGPPVLRFHAVREVDRRKAHRRLGRLRLRSGQRLHPRQRQRHASPPQKIPP